MAPREPGAPAGKAYNSAMSLFVSATRSVFQRELVRLVRQKARVVSFLLMPVLFWAMLGFGVGDNFHAGGADYKAYFFPGALLMVLLFAAIFSTITVIEDRQAGFLQGLLASAAPRPALVLGKCLGSAVAATVQGALVLALAPLAGLHFAPLAALAACGVMFLVAFGLTCVGMCMAWPMDSSAGYHALMNVILMPMWFLSGAVFPVAGAPVALKGLMLANPLTYGHGALAQCLAGDQAQMPLTFWPNLGLFALFTVLTFAVATWLVGKPGKGH